MDVPQEQSPPPAQLTRAEQTPEPPHQSSRTKQPTTKVPPEPAPRQRVNIKEKITMNPGRTKETTPYGSPRHPRRNRGNTTTNSPILCKHVKRPTGTQI